MNMFFKWAACSLLLGFILLSTQPSHSKAPQSFVGLVQFVSGDVFVESEKKDKKKLEFKSVLRTGDRILVESGSYIKLITNQDCVGVVYKGGKVFAPIHESGSWHIEGDFRWICKKGKTQKLFALPKTVELKSGEIVFFKNQLAVFGKAQAADDFANGKVYLWNSEKEDAGVWKLKEKQPTNKALAKWEKTHAAPQESEIEFETKVKGSISSRWAATLGSGGGEINHPNRDFDGDDLEINAAGLWTNFEFKGLPILAALKFRQWEEDDRYDDSHLHPDSPPRRIRLETFMAEIGLRWHFHRSWGFYALLGTGILFHSVDVDLLYEGMPEHIDLEREYWGYSATVGVNKIFWPKSSVGLYLSAEFTLVDSVFYMGEDWGEYSSVRPEYQASEQPSAIGLMFYIGPVLNF